MNNKSTPAANASRETSVHPVGPLRIRVELLVGGGVLRVGDIPAGKTVEREADEAIRLVDAKGFRYATPADAQLAAEHIHHRNAAATAQAEVAAAADGEGGGIPHMPNQE
jgi:hypothetical protein